MNLNFIPRLQRDVEIGGVDVSKGLRYNTGKRKWSLIDFKALEPIVQVLEYGMHKYSIYEDIDGKQYKGAEISLEQAKSMKVIYSGANNWKNGLDQTEVLESLARHLFALMDGEVNDPESGLPHIGHIGCNLMFWSHFQQKKNQ